MPVLLMLVEYVGPRRASWNDRLKLVPGAIYAVRPGMISGQLLLEVRAGETADGGWTWQVPPEEVRGINPLRVMRMETV